MSRVIRIKQVAESVFHIEKKVLWWWEHETTAFTSEKAEEEAKKWLARSAFRPKVLSVWSEKKPNEDKK